MLADGSKALMSPKNGKFALAAFDRSFYHCQWKPTGKSSTFPVPVGFAIHVGSPRVKSLYWFDKLDSKYGSGTSCDIATFGSSRVARRYFEITKASCSLVVKPGKILSLLPRHPEFHIWVASPTLDPACLEGPRKHPALSTGFHPIDSGSWPFWKLHSRLLQNSVHNWVRTLIFQP